MRDPAVSRLLSSGDPSVRYLVLTQVLHKSPSAPQVVATRRAISHSDKVRRLLAHQKRGGGFGVPAYAKWGGGFWRLVALAELAMPPGDRRVRALSDYVLAWLEGDRGALGPILVGGSTRVHGTVDGYALAGLTLLGLARRTQVRRLAQRLIAWQWPDGGWNCDRRLGISHSSFHETHGALWGLAEYSRVTHDRGAARAVDRAAEFLLRHRLFRSDNTGGVINDQWLAFHFPPYWHYDVLQGLWVLSRAGKLGDARAGEALDIVVEKRRRDGTWRAGGYHWKRPGGKGSNVEVVDWGRGEANEWVTLRALRVLAAAGRLEALGFR